MNLSDYETKWYWTYRDFAETVRFILKKALSTANDLPRPQSVQCRAKDVASLRRRLTEVDKLDTETLEDVRRDLAGARLIFYTNNDVERFRGSSVIPDNFTIEEDSTKTHHPMPENEGTRYRAVHFTVRLRETRISLPEYARFADLRCEIQVQTILNHAWSEMSHDILYKRELRDGFGTRAMAGITRRFDRIMDDYLVPAGFEIEKALQEYERVLQGKAIFDKDIVRLLDNAQNNNERYEVLSRLKDYALPNYNDISEAYKGLIKSLLCAVRAARCTKPVSIGTTFGQMDGVMADAVIRIVVEIAEEYRYFDTTGTLRLLIAIFRGEPDERVQRQIVDAVKRLSEYNIDSYNRFGPMLQMQLMDYLASMSGIDIDSARPIALTVWTEALESGITGVTPKADSVIVQTGAVPYSDQLEQVRDTAIRALFAAYDRSTDDARRGEVLTSLDTATTTPGCGPCSNELLAATLKDATRIVEFMTERAKATSYELLQHLEYRFHRDYFRALRYGNDESQFGCKDEARALAAAIVKFRDTVNVDDKFVRYKVLVGFESVFPEHWAEEEFEYNGAEDYRRGEVGRYVDEIDEKNENDWFELASRCAQTPSNDLATFPAFRVFINELAERKPEVAERFLARASGRLLDFLPVFLNGLAKSGRADIYERILEGEIRQARKLAGLASHFCYSDVSNATFAGHVLKRAIEENDADAVIECLLFAVRHYGTEKIEDADMFVRDALSFLDGREDCRWVRRTGYLRNAKEFCDGLSPENTRLLLHNLGYLSRVDHEAERVLTQLAERQPEAVWDYFGDRLAKKAAEGVKGDRWEAVPFRFFGLEKELAKDPHLGIRKGLSWFLRDRECFEFRGGRFLSRAFPKCTAGFAAALADLVRDGNDADVDFALAILFNYKGEVNTHTVLKEIVARYPEDDSKMSRVRIAIDNTGVVTGDCGFADAWRAKKVNLEEWLKDERPAVVEFAERHIAQLVQMIAAEQARCEADREMLKRDFDEEHDDSDSDGDNGDESAC